MKTEITVGPQFAHDSGLQTPDTNLQYVTVADEGCCVATDGLGLLAKLW